MSACQNITDFVVTKLRKSCRRFTDELIPDYIIDKFVESLRQAPSAGNLQPWHFYLIKDQRIKDKLSDAALGQNFISQAPIIFVVCAKPDESAKKYGIRGSNLYCIQDTAAATENLMIVATSYKYGCCWVGAFDTKKVSEILELPMDQIPVSIVPIGKCNEMVISTSRKKVNEILTIKGI